ncbi:hypothetical protein B0H11DRAFT_1829022 [Mycena galericulata]|nr:hypothetical protein B0H11DRAFT_1829022 [Mycena galericulata]
MDIDAVSAACDLIDTKLSAACEDRAIREAQWRDRSALFLGLLDEACLFLRDASHGEGGTQDAILERVNQTVNRAILLGYRGLDFDFLPPFAHSNEFPVLRGLKKEPNVFSHRNKKIIAVLKKYFATKPPPDPPHPNDEPRLPDAWKTTPRPHPLSSPLARFEDDVTLPSSPSPLVHAIYHARCEITGDSENQALTLVHSNNTLVFPSNENDHDRPFLTYYLLDEPCDRTFGLIAHHVPIALESLTPHCLADDSRKLMFVADNARVKSYSWASATGAIYESPLATHTFSTPEHHGPLAMLAGGPFMRTGKGSVGLWNLDELATHGVQGISRIGGLLKGKRGSNDAIEQSAGTPPASTIRYADARFEPTVWAYHPSLPATMLCATNTVASGDFSCVAVDLEHGGKIVGRYLGAFGNVRSFSTSGADPNVFLTAGNDGYARLYDVRRPLPVLTLCSSTGEDSCGGALLIHPDGVPGIFTAASRDEVIRFWDVRGKRMVYELSTGNTQVTGMAWHEAHCALYVSTTCEYMDQYGRSRGYRHAKVPRTARTLDLEGEDSDEDYDSDDDDDDDGPCWPKNAAHAEDYFGHLFDAGDHRIFRYAFKEAPDISVLPAYGEATVYSG